MAPSVSPPGSPDAAAGLGSPDLAQILATVGQPSLEALMADLRAVVQAVGEELLAQFGRVSSDQKADGSLVTQADRQADQALSAAFRARFPHHGLLTEEGQQRFDGDEWCWVIDPLDGTTNFARGVPVWGISVALLHRGQPVLGLGHFPPIGQTFWAVTGAGAWFNGERLCLGSRLDSGPDSPDSPDSLDPKIDPNDFLNLCSRSLGHYHIDLPCKPRILGSAAHNLMAVANGSVRGGLEVTPKVWDLAAAWVIVPEAGGVVRPLGAAAPFPLVPGQDYTQQSFAVLAAASESLWDKLRACLTPRR